MVKGKSLFLRMLSLGAFGVSLFFLKRAAGFAITSRYQRGHRCSAFQNACFFLVNKNSNNFFWGLREETRTFSATAKRLNPTDFARGELDKHDADGESDEEIRPRKKFFPGTIDGFSITKIYKTDQDSGFNMDQIKALVDSDEISRLELTPRNISVPIALMMLDPDEYPSKSRARKACRKANIMIHRGPLEADEDNGETIFDAAKCIRARVGFRLFPGDVVCKQVRIGDGKFPTMSHKKPPFELPVIFEDDHFAIVNKPAGVVVYANKGGGYGLMTIRAAIPFAVTPSKAGTYCTLRRPQPVHRLDKPTSGVLIIAKTKPAMVNLSQQFRDRKIKKTYTAIVNGIPPEPLESKISAKEAHLLGVDVDPDTRNEGGWQVIDNALDEKSAVTVWKAIKYSNSIHANDNVLTTVALKPKTGRFHQLRRHLSLVCKCPIVGDDNYDGGGPAMRLRREGLFLCSNKVTVEHPFYNDLKEDRKTILHRLAEKDQDKDGLWLSLEGKVMVTASIEIPDIFNSFVSEENARFSKPPTSAEE